MVVSDYAEFVYKCDNSYHPEDEGGVRFDDPSLNIDWYKWIDLEEIILSEKDKKHPSITEIDVNF